MSWEQPPWIFNQDHSSEEWWLLPLREGFPFSLLDPGLPVSHLETLPFCFLSVLSAVSYASRGKAECVERKLREGNVPCPTVNADRPAHQTPAGQQRREGWAAWDEDISTVAKVLLFLTECARVSWPGGRTNIFQLLFTHHDGFYWSSTSTVSKTRTWQGKRVFMKFQMMACGI